MNAARASIALDDTRPIWRNMLVFLVPLMASNLLQAAGQTANSIYLGRLIGVHALASVSAIFPIVFFLVSSLIGLASGSTALIAQAYGARDGERVKQIVGTTLALVLIVGIVVGTLGVVFAHAMLAALRTPADILADATSYARITFAAIPVLFAYLVYTTFMRGVGDSVTPFVALIGSTAATMILTPLFMLGAFGFPRLGIDGAAVANVASSALGLAGLLVYLGLSKHALAMDGSMLRHIRVRLGLARTIARIGVPTSLNLTMVSLSEIALLSLVDGYGSLAVAAYGAVNQIVSYVQFPAISIAIAASIFSSQAIGAGRVERVPRVVRAAVVLAYVLEGALIAVVYFFGTDIISLFIRSAPTVAVARSLLSITLWSYALFANVRVLSGIMIASGTVIWPTAISIASIWLVEVPVAYALSARIGLDGVWYGYPAAFATGLTCQTLYYLFVWRRRPLARLV